MVEVSVSVTLKVTVTGLPPDAGVVGVPPMVSVLPVVPPVTFKPSDGRPVTDHE